MSDYLSYPVVVFTLNVIKSYLLYCQKQSKNNPTTRNTKLHMLKIFFNYLQYQEIIEKSPTRKFEDTKEDSKIEVFNDQHIKQILGYYRRLKQRNKQHLRHPLSSEVNLRIQRCIDFAFGYDIVQLKPLNSYASLIFHFHKKH